MVSYGHVLRSEFVKGNERSSSQFRSADRRLLK